MGRHNAILTPPTFSGRLASQNAEELDPFVELLKAENVTRYGEIGAREGDTFHWIMSALPKKSRGVALDWPGAVWGKSSSRAHLMAAVADLVGNGYDASCLFGDSTTAATVRQFRGRGPYDAILIDGDHRLPGVTADWNNYRKSARLVAFHDIDGEGISDRRGHRVEVPLLWKSIKASGLRTVEFVKKKSDRPMGIGVVWTEAN